MYYLYDVQIGMAIAKSDRKRELNIERSNLINVLLKDQFNNWKEIKEQYIVVTKRTKEMFDNKAK